MVARASGSSATIRSSTTGRAACTSPVVASTPFPTITPARKLRMSPVAPAMK